MVFQAAAKTALSMNRKDVALQALQDALQLKYADNLGYLSALARAVDPGVSQALADAAKDRAMSPEQPAAFAHFAFYDAAIHPAACRLLLESEWATRLAREAGEKNDEGDDELGNIVVAMTAIDPPPGARNAEGAASGSRLCRPATRSGLCLTFGG